MENLSAVKGLVFFFFFPHSHLQIWIENNLYDRFAKLVFVFMFASIGGVVLVILWIIFLKIMGLHFLNYRILVLIKYLIWFISLWLYCSNLDTWERCYTKIFRLLEILDYSDLFWLFMWDIKRRERLERSKG